MKPSKAILVFVLPAAAFALGQPRYVETTARPGSFPIAHAKTCAAIYVDPADYPGVIRAAGDLQADINRVTGCTPVLTHDAPRPGAHTIVIGSRDQGSLVKQLTDTGVIAGKWESFLIQPVAGNLVIAGSDKRGTIYGIYDLSEQIGVSPWYWWADVPVAHKDALFVKPGRFTEGEPAVKYRGIFLNDEAPSLSGWTHEKNGGFNSKFYVKVFELILRLKGNYLWPAMWGNAFNEDDPLNPKLADEYGIVMGTSHHEPMLRAQQEWKRHGKGPWNYATNEQVLHEFWEQGIERNKSYESIVTLGMRGDGDMPMAANGGIEANKALLEKIVADQRDILAKQIGPDLSKIPQDWALYKEVQDYYDAGMRVPDDVTLLWCDDNWGNLRRVPTAEERKRSGGAGIYYHFDYVGGPRNYKWLNTVPITKVWEQMNLAYQYDARRIWIVNVGDLKPMEFPIEYFLSLASNPERWPHQKIAEFGRLWAEREFGPTYAADIADIVAKYTKYNGRRKPELLEPGTFSENYGEADRVLAEWHAITERAEQIYKKLPANAKDAFFELVLYPTKACAQVNEMYIAAARGDAARTRELFQADADLSAAYNHTLAGGKWDHMMDQTHIGYTGWQQPDKNTMPAVSQIARPRVSPAARPDGYVSIEAAHYTKKTAAGPVHWDEIKDYGRTLSSMTIVPCTAASRTPPENSPSLEYRMYLHDPGAVKVNTIIAPTLNFVPGRGLRFAVAFDDQPPQIIDALAHNSLKDWEESVKDSVRTIVSSHSLTGTGYHTLKYWMVDPGVVLQKIVVDLGGLKPSYLGPPESFSAPN